MPNGEITYYLEGFEDKLHPEYEPDWLTIDSSTGQITGAPPSERTFTKFYIYAKSGQYRSYTEVIKIYINTPVPEFDSDAALAINISATDVRNSSNVGKVLDTLDISGKFTNPATIGTVKLVIILW